MSTVEMLSLAIALGWIILFPIVAVWVALFTEPSLREQEMREYGEARKQRLAAQDEIGRARYRREHLGTPYIRQAPQLVDAFVEAQANATAQLLGIDDHNGSRKAPDRLEVVGK